MLQNFSFYTFKRIGSGSEDSFFRLRGNESCYQMKGERGRKRSTELYHRTSMSVRLKSNLWQVLKERNGEKERELEGKKEYESNMKQ